MFDSFFGGVHPDEHKERTEGSPTVPLPKAPPQVVIPMAMHVGAPCKPIVAKGDLVQVGTLIGKTVGLGAPIHASVSGRVAAVEPRPYSGGGMMMSVVIDNDFQDTPAPAVARSPEQIDALTGTEIIEIIRNAGITGMGGAGFPTHVKLSGAAGKVDTYLLNGAECEPYITSDHRLMLERGEAVLGGARLLARAVGLQKVCLGIEHNKSDAIALLKHLASEMEGIQIQALNVRYPQGAEKQLIQRLTGRQVPSGKLPVDVKCIVSNVATAAAVWDAVAGGKPLTRRIVTLTGGAVAKPGNVLAPVGTPVRHLIELAGGFQETPERILFGGPMMGNPIYDLDVSTLKTTNAILCMTKDEVAEQDPAQTCIRCGRCVDVCPMRLAPLWMRLRTERRMWDEAEALGVMDCIECGSCSYICPARLPLVQSFRAAKFVIRDAAARARVARAKEALKA